MYRPRPVARRRDTVVFYARASTPRRAVPLGLLALGIVKGRRPDLRIVLFGDSDPPRTTFPYENAGIASPAQLARLYSEATVGVCLSMTNYSLVPKEMLACGLPVVDLRGQSAASIFGPRPVELAEHDPWDLARPSSACSTTSPPGQTTPSREKRSSRDAHLGHGSGRSSHRTQSYAWSNPIRLTMHVYLASATATAPALRRYAKNVKNAKTWQKYANVTTSVTNVHATITRSCLGNAKQAPTATAVRGIIAGNAYLPCSATVSLE